MVIDVCIGITYVEWFSISKTILVPYNQNNKTFVGVGITIVEVFSTTTHLTSPYYAMTTTLER